MLGSRWTINVGAAVVIVMAAVASPAEAQQKAPPPPGAAWTPGPEFTVGGDQATTASDTLASGDTVTVDVPGAGSTGPALPAGTQLQFFTAASSQLIAPTTAGALADAVAIAWVAPDGSSFGANAFLTLKVSGPAVQPDLVPAYGLAPAGLVPAPFLAGPGTPPLRFVGGASATTTAPNSTVYAGGAGSNFVTTSGGSAYDSNVRYLTTVGPSVITTFTTTPVGLATFSPGGDGYRLAGADGGVFSFGTDPFAGSLAGHRLAGAVGAYRATPDTHGYWLAGADGGVFCFGDARFFGSAAGDRPAPITELIPTADNGGYSLLAADGSVYSFGDSDSSSAPFPTPYPWRTGDRAVAYVPTLRGGAWEATTNGAVFSSGLAEFYGAPASLGHLAAPIVAMVATPDGRGYWLASADGGVFSYGDAPFFGSAVPERSVAPIVGMAITADGHGYRLFASDGGIFDFGDATYHGSMGGRRLAGPITSGGA